MSRSFVQLTLKLLLENWLSFAQIMSYDGHKYLNNKRLPWKQTRAYFPNFAFSKTFKDTPDSLQDFKFLNSSAYEIRGLPTSPPPPSINFGYQRL